MFPDDGVIVHLNVFEVTEVHHVEIQRLRHDVRDLIRYLRREELFTSLNHVASGSGMSDYRRAHCRLTALGQRARNHQRLATRRPESHRAVSGGSGRQDWDSRQ